MQQRELALTSGGRRLQGYDGDRDARFGDPLPEIRDAAKDAQVHMMVNSSSAGVYDRSSSGHFTVEVAERAVQLYDHVEGVWFDYDVQLV